MNKVVLGKRPTVLRRLIEVLQADGTTGVIPVQYKYRTRREYAAFTDGLVADVKLKAEALVAGPAPVPAAKPRRGAKGKPEAAPAPPPPVTFLDITDLGIAANVDQLLQFVEGWDLDVPFSRDALDQLCNEIPGAVQALVEGYRNAVNLGHSGN